MADEPLETNRDLVADQRRWQIWSIVVLGIGLLGLALALYYLAASARDSRSLAALLGPMLYGLFAILVLFAYYVAQREAVVHGLRQELIKQKIEAELNRELALLDPVTEVYNRRYARAILRREIGRVKRYGSRLSVMMLDVTGFRRVNDSLGLAGGDVVLREIAHLLQTGLRNSDMIVRYGGDEFLLILTESDDEGIAALGDRLKAAFVEWTRRSGLHEFGLRFALGVAHYVPERRVDEMLGLAEQRMLEDRRSADGGRESRADRTAAANP